MIIYSIKEAPWPAYSKNTPPLSHLTVPKPQVISAMIKHESAAAAAAAAQHSPQQEPHSEPSGQSPSSSPTSPRVPQLSPKQKGFQIEALMTSAAGSSPKPQDNKPALPGTATMSVTEILNAKTLVTSYREAANFLYRAASELEQLLPNDHRVF